MTLSLLWRILPFLGKALVNLERQRLHERCEDLQRRLDDAQRDRDYWRIRAEKLTDAALARAGAIHEPTMRDVKPPPPSPAELITSALGVQEIDSSKR